MSIHTEAIRGLFRHPATMLMTLVTQLAARALACCPLWLPALLSVKGTLFSSAVFQGCACLLLWIFIVFPSRFIAALTLGKAVSNRDISRLRPAPYFRLVLAGFTRLCLGALWAIPFAGCVYLAYLYTFVYDGSQYGKAIESLGAAISRIFPLGDPYTLGLIGVCVTFLASSLLFAFGWRQLIPFDFQMVGSATVRRALRISGKVRKQCKKQLFINSLLHFVILLPAVIGAFAVLYLRCGGYSQALMNVYLLISTGMNPDPGTFHLALIVFLALYLPFVLYRKARNAAVVVNCNAKNS